ncbi:MAG: aldehyde dehydrogenase family protein [Candidatus Omnitrophica bacterium]|nr:aldehyde dehydrogenase family protein [Candidatus Omnitrophota bacterium]MBL7210645.1 aldehyde dehydrogenase family protein [Candidatus Omnitrophota bacterium]
MIPSYPLFINGEFKESAHKDKILNPSTGEVLAEASVADRKDINLALVSARAAFDQGPWREAGLAERKEILLKIAAGILENAEELAKLETLNTGKPIKETTFMDVPSAAKAFEHFANNLNNYLDEEIISVSGDVEARLVHEPRGVAALIVPWNYPFLIACWKLAQALAAGNSVILKPSSLTPLTVLELGRIIQKTGLPKGVVNIINGDGESVGEALCSDRWVDMISFTGSNEVGRKIIGYAAKHVKKMIMELGGKSAGIVLKDADLELAVNGSLCSIFLNQGQMCTAMSRILVEDDIYDDFLKEFLAKVKRIKLGKGLDHEAQMGPLICEAQRKKVMASVHKAKQEGAKLLCGGKIPEAPELKGGFFFEPAVFEEVNPDMGIFKEEVFGPVVCIGKFSSLEEAVKLANNSDFALAGAIWTKDDKLARELSAKINAGIIWVNTYGMFFSEVPYGGFKQSGFGKELGREGLMEYTRLKSVIIDKTKDAKPLINYWYGF